MKARHLLLLLMLLALPITNAAEEELHDEWHAYHDFFTIGEDYYEITTVQLLSGDGDEMLLKSLLKRNQESNIITAKATRIDDDFALEESSCKKQGQYRFCIAEISLEPEEGARSDENGIYRYGLRLEIHREIPEQAELEMTRTVKDNPLRYGEETQVSVRITNTGTQPATNIDYEETVGEGLTITRTDGYGSRTGTKIKASKDKLYPDERLDYNYWIRATKYQNTTTLSGSVTYDDPDSATASKDTTITIPWPFASAYSLTPTSIKPNQDVTISYTVTNNENKEMHIAVTATLDNGIIVTTKEGWEKSGSKLIYAGTLPANEQKTFNAKLTSRYTGTYAVAADLQAEVNDYPYERHDESSYEVKTDTITPNVVFSKDKMRSGEAITIGVYLRNEDDQLPFFNIQGNVKSDFFEEAFSIEKIAPKKNENPLFKTYRPPRVDEQTTHIVEVSGTFMTQNNERKEFYTQEEFTILREDQSIVLGQALDRNELKRGEEVTITIDVENIADSGSSNVDVANDYDERLEKTFGDAAGSTFLYGGESRQLIVFKLKVPYDYDQESFNITSTLYEKGVKVTDLSKKVTVTDPVEPTQEPATPAGEQGREEIESSPQEPTQGNETPQTQGEMELAPQEPNNPYDEKEPGFLKRIVDGIANFFTGFFS